MWLHMPSIAQLSTLKLTPLFNLITFAISAKNSNLCSICTNLPKSRLTHTLASRCPQNRSALHQTKFQTQMWRSGSPTTSLTTRKDYQPSLMLTSSLKRRAFRKFTCSQPSRKCLQFTEHLPLSSATDSDLPLSMQKVALLETSQKTLMSQSGQLYLCRTSLQHLTRMALTNTTFLKAKWSCQSWSSFVSHSP